MTQRIYASEGNGELVPLKEEGFADEDTLQRLIAEHPELLDGEQIRPSNPRRWILIDREVGVADTVGSSARWSLDHLLIDQDGVPTLVEVKLRSNPEMRRTVVGQLLEYAAHAPRTWAVEDLRDLFESSSRDADGELGLLLGGDGDLDADAFWDTVSANLAAKRVRLLFVSDAIPDELARVVEFLNEQMPDVEVLAVEVKQFLRGPIRTLVPRVIGRTAGSAASKSNSRRGRLDRSGLFNELDDEEGMVVERLLSAAEECGARLTWGSSSVTIRAVCDSWAKTVPVAWIYAPSTSWERQRGFSFGVTLWDSEMPDDIRSFFSEWAGQFAEDSFAKDVSWEGVTCWRVTYHDGVAHVDSLESRLRKVLTDARRR